MQSVRDNATTTLKMAASQDFASYVRALCQALCTESVPVEIRQAAGVAVKNTLVSKDAQVLGEYSSRWLALDGSVRDYIKEQLLSSLGSESAKAGGAAAQATAAIAFVELPSGAWPNLMSRLVSGAQSSSDNLRRGSIECIGFICEEIDPKVLTSSSNEILTAVVNGLRSEESNPLVRAAAAKALLLCVEFIRGNFDHTDERDFIMSVICTATQSDFDAVRLPAYECLTRIMQLYYPQMAPYMERGIVTLTVNAILNDAFASVQLQAIEFWSTVADIERDLQDAENCEFECLDFCRKALPYLLPALLRLLKQSTEDADLEEWSTSMAAATCIGLLAECVKNSIFVNGILLQFIQENVSPGPSGDWRSKEAALMAFGSIMDGPDAQHVELLVKQGLPLVLSLLSDTSVAVRDTAAWVTGRVIDFFFDLVPSDALSSIVNSLVKGTGDVPRVAANCCWSLMSLAVHYGDDNNELNTSEVSPHWSLIATALFSATQRPDADQHNLLTASFQALATLILFAPMDCVPEVAKLQQVIVTQQSESQQLANQIVNVDDRMHYSELQSNLSIVLCNSIKKLGAPSLHVSDQIMTSVMNIFENAARGKGSATELEDVFMLVGTLIGELNDGFLRFVDPFMPILLAAIANPSETNLCSVAIGVVGDLARALNQCLLPFADSLVKGLLSIIVESGVLSVKTHAVSALGDIALVLGGSFVSKLSAVMQALSSPLIDLRPSDPEDFDEVDMICELRENLIQTYTSIVQGLKDDDSARITLSAFLPQFMALVHRISLDEHRTDGMTRSAIGLIGDLADAYPVEMRAALQQNPAIIEFINRSVDGASEATISIVKWTMSVINKSLF